MDALIESPPIEVPKALVQAESDQLADNARRDLEMRGLKTKDIPGRSVVVQTRPSAASSWA